MKVTIAALLHDIGKFYQRTGNLLGDKALYQKYIKNGKNYLHSGYTAKFFDENIKETIPDYLNVLDMSAGYHQYSNSIIKKADYIATGHDRKDLSEQILSEYEKIDNEKDNNSITRLDTIFNEINIDKNQVNERYELKLTSAKALLNQKYVEKKLLDASKIEYKNLYNNLELALKEMNDKGYKDYKELHHLLYPIIKENTVTVPGYVDKKGVSTISLFDHLKLTTAIANCLEKDENANYALIDYDISGIQKFIYKVAEGRESKPKVAKHLRTRSFYLSVLTDFIAYYIVNEFGVTYENVLYSSGGRGRILVTKGPNFEEKLKEIAVKIEQAMFKMHNCDISFSIAYTEVDDEGLIKSQIDDLVREGVTFISDKKKKFKSILNNIDLNEENKDFCLCPICFSNKVNNEEVCSFCDTLLKINDRVLTSYDEFIIEYDYLNNDSKAEAIVKVNGLGTIRMYSAKKFVLENVDSYYVSVNNYKIGETKLYAKSNIGSKSFEEIAKNSTGDDKLAVLKMDVDNLGYIFLNGIKQSKETISKNLTLSRMVDYFFSKEIVNICNQPKFKESMYINYAGGDDLVIISPASMVLELVKDINYEFSKFTGYNKSLHISAGIEFFSSKSPVRYSIERAEDNLSESKLQDNKNSFNLLGVTLNNSKMNYLLEEIEVFEKGLLDETLSRSGLYEIYEYIIRSLEVNNSEHAFMRFIPLIAYSIKRNMNEKWFEKLRQIFVVKEVKKEVIEFYKIVFAMALMKTRKRG